MRVFFLLVLIAAVAYAASSPADESREEKVKQKLTKAKLSANKTANHVVDVINNFLKRNTINSPAVHKKLISARRAAEKVLSNLKLNYKKGRYTVSDNYRDAKINWNKFVSSLFNRASKIAEATVKFADRGGKKVGSNRPRTADDVNILKEQLKRAMSVTHKSVKNAMEVFDRGLQKQGNSGSDEKVNVNLAQLGKSLTKSTKEKIKAAFRAMKNIGNPRVFEESEGKWSKITEKDAVKKLLSTIKGIVKKENK